MNGGEEDGWMGEAEDGHDGRWPMVVVVDEWINDGAEDGWMGEVDDGGGGGWTNG